MVDLYISERVKELTRGKQIPAIANPQTIPDFPLVLKKKNPMSKILEKSLEGL